MTEILVDISRFRELERYLGAMTVEEEMDLANRYTNYEFASQISGPQFVNLVNFINNLLKTRESRKSSVMLADEQFTKKILSQFDEAVKERCVFKEWPKVQPGEPRPQTRGYEK